MENAWADLASRLGVDLHLDLRPDDSHGRRRGLAEALRAAVRSGRLRAGDRLPPYRSLAADLGLSRGTVAAVYQELIAEGWLAARQGSGTMVADVLPDRSAATGPHAMARPDPQYRHDFQLGQPTPALFPRADWIAATRRAVGAAPNSAFAAGHAQGYRPLREALARYLARIRGVRTTADNIVVTASVSQAAELLGRTLGGPIAVESYGLQLHGQLLEQGGAQTIPIAIDDDGLRVDQLSDNLTAVLCTPTHQFPTGVALAPARRSALLEHARRTNMLVLEDDYDGELRYDREPIGALQALAPELVLYLGTASKSLSPAVRIAWMAVPDHLVDTMIAAKGPREGTASVVDQMIFADLIESGAYDRHVRRSRQYYRRRRDRLLELLGDEAPVRGIAAGLHAVIELPTGAEQSVVAEGDRRGFRMLGLDEYRHPDATDRVADGLVIGFGSPPASKFDDDVRALAALLVTAGG
ncbi:MocR-like pyridoxine biosynthesis transcription factor PdxR [Jongsikchunia kroppenstedtii]|uniref:MocR-like pyridoxine biosynthesis transcription factor PdxR n=1 Tax=Jongsikchunia kroppenstedtii TaxID=1121721 RepID=UPI00036104C6|nr:PLP-dependent aminotransferase family protein [Jongsikchunia kroppenstedtii]